MPWPRLCRRRSSAGDSDQRGHFADGRRFEQDRDREIHVPRPADLREQPDGDQRVAAQIEEAVFRADPIDTQKVGPEARQRRFDRAVGFDVITVERGTFEFLAALAFRILDLSGLFDQGGKVHGTDNDIGPVQSQCAQEQVGPFFGADALAQVVPQAFFGG